MSHTSTSISSIMGRHQLKGMSSNNPNTHLPSHPEISKTLVTSTSRSKRTYNCAFGHEESGHETHGACDSNIAESVSFLDAFLANRVLLQTFTAQEINKFKYVSRSWATATTDNAIIINNVRRYNQSYDWYFPMFSSTYHAGSSRMLHGMWHGESSTTKLGMLPSLDYLPRPTAPNANQSDVCICKAYRNELEYFVVASSGSLLLIETVHSLITRKGSRNPNIAHNRSHGFYSNNWPSLIVTNPVTKLFQVLPLYDRKSHGEGSICTPQFHMVVDEIANSYKVLVLWSSRTSSRVPPQLLVYHSGSQKWDDLGLLQTPQEPSFGCSDKSYSYFTIFATACTRGRLFLADLRHPTSRESRMDHLVRGVVRLFDVDIETGQVILRSEILLHQSYRYNPPFLSFILRNLELVECMGYMYAVIPAQLDEYLYVPNNYRENFWHATMIPLHQSYLPVQFHILQLEGDVGVEGPGVLRIQVPTTRNKMRSHALRVHSSSNSKMDKFTPGENWFACTGKGSAIWLTTEDYLLQYDVLSGESTTEILPKHLRTQQKVDMAYRASFTMKP